MDAADADAIFPVLPRPAAEDGGEAATTNEAEQPQQFHEAVGPTDDAALLDGDVPQLPSPRDYQGDGAETPAVELAAEMEAQPQKREAEQDVTTLNHEEAKRQKMSAAIPAKKQRREFTASEKLRILNLLDGNKSGEVATAADGSILPEQPTLTNKQAREKFGISKSSLHRWRQMKHRLEVMVSEEGLGGRKRDSRDPLEKIKTELQKFYNENLEKSPDERMMITTPVVHAMACKIRDELLAEYDAAVADAAAAAAIDVDNEQQDQTPKLNLSDEEVAALRAFKVTSSWSGRLASAMGWLSESRKKSSNAQQLQDGEQQVDASFSAVDSAASHDITATNLQLQEDATEKAKLNTLAFLSKSHPDYSGPKVKKVRKEFTAVEKLAIINEMDPEHTAKPLVMAEICEKYNTSKSSVFRWKQQYRSGTLTQMIDEEGRGSFKRDVNDKLGKVKLRLKEFIEDNRAQPPETRAPLSSGVLQGKAQQFRDELLAQHEYDPSKSDLKDDEVDALRKFKASKGWARKAAARYGWKEVEDPGYVVAESLRTEAAAAIAAASVAAAEVSVDALMGHPSVVVPTLPPQHVEREEEEDVVIMQHSDEHQQNQHEDAVNVAMHSMMDGDLGDGVEI